MPECDRYVQTDPHVFLSISTRFSPENPQAQALSGHDGPLRMADFDFAARRFLGELRSRDRSDGGARRGLTW